MSKLTQRWLQMGAELEGSWDLTRAKTAEKVRGAKAVKDPSVHIGIGDPGEIITRPHASLDALCEDIGVLYPDHVHETCGFHIHTSFTPMNGSVIASGDFYAYFKEQWDRWGRTEKFERNHEFWRRLSGANKNARDEFTPETQLKGDGRGGKGGNARYTMLNFYSWELHKTVECRLLPMFRDRDVGIRATRHLAWIYDSYLGSHGFSGLKFEAASEVQGERVLETYEMKTPDTVRKTYQAEGTFPPLLQGHDVYYAIPGASMDDMLPFNAETDKQTA